MLHRRMLGLGLLLATRAGAQPLPWPRHAVRILVGFAPGGLTDVLARVLAARLAERFGQPSVVENRAGASGIIAAEAVAKATDGHTLLLAHPTALAIAPGFGQRLPFDAEHAFTPISLLALQPHLLLTRAEAPWADAAALVAAARARPGALSYGSSGVGSVQHIQGEQFCAATGIAAVHVPYRGSAPTMADLAAGQLDFAIDGVGVARPLIEAGRLRPLATSNATRVAAYPALPTLAEGGIDGVLPGSWFGLVGPAGMPEAVQAALHQGCVAGLAAPEVARALANAAAEALGTTPAAFADFVQEQIAGFRRLARSRAIALD